MPEAGADIPAQFRRPDVAVADIALIARCRLDQRAARQQRIASYVADQAHGAAAARVQIATHSLAAGNRPGEEIAGPAEPARFYVATERAPETGIGLGGVDVGKRLINLNHRTHD